MMTSLTAFTKSLIFPIVHHLAANNNQKQLGQSVSRVYFSNILGSSLGPLVTGFILLDHLNLGTAYSVLAITTLSIGAALYLLIYFKSHHKLSILSITPGVLTAVIVLTLSQEFKPIQQVITKQHTISSQEIVQIEQNKHGIVYVLKGKKCNILFGGNTYDGCFNIEPAISTNGIGRAYFIAALHPTPKKVLMIGLSSGSWGRVITSLPGMTQLDIVEINSAYVDLVSKTPEVQGLLQDSRVNIHIDDGRRWLNLSPEQYDVIIMNTTWHWKSYTSALLSSDFHNIIKQKLRDQGIFYFNTTQSIDALYTASLNFDYVGSYSNFAVASNSNIWQNLHQMNDRLTELHLNGQKIFNESNQPALDKITTRPLVPAQKIINNNLARTPEKITDNNMITEYKFGKHFF